MSQRWTLTDLAEYQSRRETACAGGRVEPKVAMLPTKSFVVLGVPVAKPRQTRSDKWKRRPCVLKYRDWADKAREAMCHAMGTVSFTAGRLDVVAYFPLRKGLSAKVIEGVRGSVHMSKPDADNVLKAVSDALCRNDQMIHDMSVRKRWDDGGGPRVEITIS